MSADLLGVPSINSSSTAPLNSLDTQVNSLFRTAKKNSQAQSRATTGAPPVDVKKPNLASYVTFPDSEVAAVVPYTKSSVGAPLPSVQGFTDWLCSKAVQEIRKLPGTSLVPKQLLKDLCVLGINSGLNTIPKLKQFVKSKLTTRRMARLSSKPSSSQAAKVVPAMRSMSISAPVAIGKRVASRNKPRFLNKNGNVTISHTEFIGNLFSHGTTLLYNSANYVINPGNVGTFPWLSTFASNFDKYKIHKLAVHLVSNQATSTAGRIGVGIDYDSTDPMPADRGEFFNLTHHQETSPWDSLILNIPIKPEEKFVNSHTVSDSKLIDCGQIVVMADQIVATGANLADVIVEYVVELIQPQQAVYNTQILTGVHPSAFTDLTVVGPVIGKLVSTTSTTVLELSLPAGYYLVTSNVYDAAAGSPTAAITVHSASGTAGATGSTTFYNAIGVIKATGPDSKVKITYGAVAIVSLENVNITISRISAAVYVATAYTGGIGTY